jgi:hypothetical protein
LNIGFVLIGVDESKKKAKQKAALKALGKKKEEKDEVDKDGRSFTIHISAVAL